MNHIGYGHGDGLLTQDSHRLFSIGFYELPAEDEALSAMAEAGVNLIPFPTYCVTFGTNYEKPIWL